jgi:hypothetical protein
MNNITKFGLLGIIFLSGCSQDDLKLIQANKEIKVFPSIEERDKTLFTLMPGEVCAVGDKIEGKAFTYRKVLCENGKSGYIYARVDKVYNLIKEK